MLRARFVALVLLAALLPAAQASAAPADRTAGAPATFKDAPGDSGAAPDVTDVSIGNDVVAGPIVFWIRLENRPEDLSGDDAVFLLIDADRDPATGDDGIEFIVGVDADSVWMDRWDGTQYVEADGSSLRATYVKAVRSLRISVHPDQVAGTRGFGLYVVSFSGDDADVAPNAAPAWTYELASGRPALVALAFALAPKAPAARKALTATLAVGRGDTLDILDQGKVTCRLVVGGKALKPARAAFVQGLPQCRWNLPRSAKGKKLTGTITVAFGGSTVKRSFKGRVR